MKTALIAGLALSTLALTACNTNKADAPQKPTDTIRGEHHGKHGDAPRHEGKRGEGRGEHHRGKHSDHPHVYQCENNTTVVAKYNPRGGTATINVTAPSLSLDKQDIELKHATSGSGMRFVNETNPASLYEWHAKGAEGLLSVKVNGTEYNFTCQGERPPMPEGKAAPQDANHQGM